MMPTACGRGGGIDERRVGVGLIEVDDHRLDEYARTLSARGIVAPVFGVDVRNREDVLLLVETLLCVLEAQTFETDHAAH